MRRQMSVLVLVAVLVMSLGCGSSKGRDPAPDPTAMVAVAQPKATPTTAAAAPADEDAADLEALDLVRNEAGGFAFRPVAGYIVESSADASVLLAPDATANGPAMMPMGGDFWEDVTPEMLLEIFAAEDGLETGEPAAASVGGAAGITAEQTGEDVRGRAVAVMPTATQGFVLLARAPEGRWDAFAPLVEDLLASVAFFAPVAAVSDDGGQVTSDPTAAPGWTVWSDANEVRGLVVHEGTLYTVGLGGAVTWDLASGTATKATTLDGLSHISLRDATYCEVPLLPGAAPRPAIVVATDAGVSAYDIASATWSALDPGLDGFPLKSRVSRLFCDAANSRLLMSSDGLGIWDYANGTWQRITTSDGLLWNDARGIAVRGDEIWVGSGYNGISVVKAGAVTATYNDANGLPDNRAHAIALDRDGQTLWIGTAKGLVRAAGGGWTVFGPDTVDGMPRGSLYRVVVAPDGTLWVGGETGAVCHFEPASGTCVETYQPEGFSPFVAALTVDSDGLATIADGRTAIHSQAEGGWRTLVYEGEVLASNFADAIFEDGEGMLWVGTNGGLQRLDPADPGAAWETFAKEDGTGGGRAQGIAMSPDGTLWFAMVNGDATRYANGTWSAKEGLRTARAVGADAQGRGWFGTDKGVVIWDGASESALTEADGLPNPTVNALLRDGEAMWIGTGGGLARWENGSVAVILPKDDAALKGGTIQALALLDDGALLIGTMGGLARYHGAAADPLAGAGAAIRDIAVGPDGRIWVTAGDTLRFSDDGGATWTSWTTADGLPTNYLAGLAIDRFGTLWVSGGGDGSGGGLARWVP